MANNNVVLLLDAQKAYWRNPALQIDDIFSSEKPIAANYGFQHICSNNEASVLSSRSFYDPMYSTIPHKTVSNDYTHTVFHKSKNFPLRVHLTAHAEPWDKIILTDNQYTLLFE